MHVDGAAAGEAQLLEQVLHDDVVPVGVDAQMAALFIRPVDAEGAHAPAGAVGGDAVHHAVGAVVLPGAAGDLPVGGLDILPGSEIEDAQDPARVGDADKAFAFGDVPADQSLRGPVGGAPLVRVAVPGHKAAGIGVDFHDLGQVFKGGGTDTHGKLLSNSKFIIHNYLGFPTKDVPGILKVYIPGGDLSARPAALVGMTH